VTIPNLGLYTTHVACGYLGACANPVDTLPFIKIADKGKHCMLYSTCTQGKCCGFSRQVHEQVFQEGMQQVPAAAGSAI
jgi:hypothetical protein